MTQNNSAFEPNSLVKKTLSKLHRSEAPSVASQRNACHFCLALVSVSMTGGEAFGI